MRTKIDLPHLTKTFNFPEATFLKKEKESRHKIKIFFHSRGNLERIDACTNHAINEFIVRNCHITLREVYFFIFVPIL